MTSGRPNPPRCFCGNTSKLLNSQYVCSVKKCPFRVRAAPDLTPERPRQASSTSFGERCSCGDLVTTIVMDPVGLQPGRRYVRCARHVKHRCKYFRLLQTIQPGEARHDFRRSNVNVPVQSNSHFNPLPATAQPRSSADSKSTYGGSTEGAASSNVENNDTNDEEAPPCKCGKPGVKRTVKKEGPNKGKQFYVCAKPQGDQCRFFEWANQMKRNQIAANTFKRPNEGLARDVHNGPDTKKQKQGLTHQVKLDLEEIDTLSFKLRVGSSQPIRDAVTQFPSAKVVKTEFLGVEKVLVPIDQLSSFEQYMQSRANTRVEYNVPRVLVDRILRFREAEKRREDGGDVVKQSLDEVLPASVCEKLMQFQWHGVHFALKRGGRCLIGDDMGLGKTLQAIAVARVYMSDWPLLIVCPSSLRLNWKEELLRWLEGDIEESQVLVMMTGKDIDRPLRMVNIVSYDLMRKVPPEFVRRCKFIIADESHYLKSMTAQRSKALTPLLKNAKRALLLSGTPALSRPVELFPQINAISPILFPKYQEYVERYCAAHVGRFGYDVSGASNLDELHTLLRGSLLIRRKKEEVLTQLPDKQRQVMWVETKPKVMKQVARAFAELEDAKERMNSASDESHAHALLNEVKAAQNELYNLAGQAKLDSVLDFCKDTAETGCKFIVFAHHKAIIDAIDEFISGKLKLSLIRIDGSTAQAVRQQLCKRFQEDKRCRVALLSITAAGVGLTLTEASVVIFAELYWNPGSLLQAEDRAHRIGQRDCVLVKYLLARKTMDESMWGTVRRKLTVVGHSLTGTAARMDITENGSTNPVTRGSISSFFKPKPQSQSQSIKGTQMTTQDDNDIIEIIDNDTQQTITPSQLEHRDSQRKPHRSEDPGNLFPTSLDEIAPSRTNGVRAARRLGSHIVMDLTDAKDADSIADEDLQAAVQAQEQLDADIALARKLQAQFDAEIG